MSAPALIGQPVSIEVGGRIMPFTSFEDVTASMRAAAGRHPGIRAYHMPQVYVLDETGRRIATVGGRRSFAIDDDGYTDHSRCLYDCGEDMYFDFGQDD